MTNTEKVKIENIVASGKLKPELDLAAVSDDLEKQNGISDIEHSRKSGNRLLIYFSDINILGILSPNSVYIFNGVDNFSDLEDAKQILLNGLAELGIISSPNPSKLEMSKPFEIRNVVCTGDLESELNLEALSIGLGLENVEYEPEQFPGLVYKPSGSGSTVLIFASGKVVVTGVVDKKAAQEAFNSVHKRVESLFGNK